MGISSQAHTFVGKANGDFTNIHVSVCVVLGSKRHEVALQVANIIIIITIVINVILLLIIIISVFATLQLFPPLYVCPACLWTHTHTHKQARLNLCI